jgi:ABC-2 type transport system permease protein
MTTTVVPATPTATDGVHRPRGFLHDTLVFTRRGLVHLKRQPEALADATIQPVMFVLLFAYVFGGSIEVPEIGRAHV